MIVTVDFRGESHTIVVDRYIDDPDTNSCEVEWHFFDVEPPAHDALNVTDSEEDAIIEQIHHAVAEAD